ncbi:cysteine desulfurase [Candidatus Chlorohelix sp.]|uniref:cysteine desulfurase n=1 Tax=Candidatus Chlorohelix sp. TaxID=3139201 RepID=UPI003043D799
MTEIESLDQEREKRAFDIPEIRRDFPILQELTNGKPSVYLDSTASSLRPEQVVGSMLDYYHKCNANIHRGVYRWSEEATFKYERAHGKVKWFLNARSHKEIIFTRNTTESINLVAHTWGRANIKEGDEIVSTVMEHHSNIVPWQMLAQEKGAKVRYIKVNEEGKLDLSNIDEIINKKTKLVAVTHMSNVLGTINPVAELAKKAHAVGALILVDAAQSVPHLPVDVQALDIDFLAFSGHKMCGPTGIGVLWARRHLLEAMPPFLTGGDMIRSVTLEGSTWNDLPWKFEAGTPAIAEGIGLGAAVDYLASFGMDKIRAHEIEITRYALGQLREVPDLHIYGPRKAEERGGVVAFNLGEVHPHDLATMLDRDGIAVRAGHHCAQPLHDFLDLPATTRASFYIYNTLEEVDKLVESLYRIRKVFKLA